MGPLNKLPQRKSSILGMHSQYRSVHPTPSDGIRPSTSSSQSERRHMRLRNFFGKSRDPEAHPQVFTPPSSSTTSSPLSIIPKFTKAFVNALSSTQLCDLLTWILYYDVVELPEAPEAWYKGINNVEMRGWIALGDFLTKLHETDAVHEFDLIVLDSICDRIGLSRSTVRTLLIHVADPEKMKYSSLVLDACMLQDDDATTLKILETTQSKLHELYKLAIHLKPQQGSQYEEWLGIIQKRLHSFLHLVIDPHIAHLRLGKPLTTAVTSDQLPKNVTEGIKMISLYEAMQQERTVPLERYGIHPALTCNAHPTPQSSSPPVLGDEAEPARNHAIELMVENRELRSQLAVLHQDKARLVKANEKLAQKLVRLGRLQPAGYIRYGDQPVNRPDDDDKNDEARPMTLHAPPANGRRRSVSTGDIEGLAAALGQGLHITTHQHQQSGILAQKYEDVFSSLLSSPLPSLRLSTLQTPTIPSSSIADLTAARPMTLGHAPQSGRRSGMIFDRKGMGYLAGSGQRTPTVEESDDEGNQEQTGGYVPLTPTPEGRKRFDLLN